MKKLLILLAFVPLVSFGQFSKGTKYVGGSFSYYSNKYDTGAGMAPASTYFSSQGHLGIFLNESFAIGPAINYFRNNIPSINPATNLFEDRSNNGLSGGVLARKFFSITDVFLFSLEGSALVGQINRNTQSQFVEPKSTILNLSLIPAFIFLPNKKWGFDASIGLLRYGSNYRNAFTEEKNFEARLGQIHLGAQYFFSR